MNVFDVPQIADHIASFVMDDEGALKNIFGLSSNPLSQATIARRCEPIRVRHRMKTELQLAIANLENAQGSRAERALFVDLMDLTLQCIKVDAFDDKELLRAISRKIDLAWLSDDTQTKTLATHYHNTFITWLNWAFDGHIDAPWWWREENDLWDDSYEIDESQFDW